MLVYCLVSYLVKEMNEKAWALPFIDCVTVRHILDLSSLSFLFFFHFFPLFLTDRFFFFLKNRKELVIKHAEKICQQLQALSSRKNGTDLSTKEKEMNEKA